MAYSTITKPADYFNTVLYAGDNSTSNAITGVGFQPDWIWIKNRSAISSQLFQDSVRGKSGSNYLYLQANDTAAEAAQGDNDGLNTIGSDGFTVGYTNSVGWNASGNNYVSWNWLAGGTASSNTDGSSTSSVSANTTSGFSIVSFTGTGANATVGHGLSSAPKMVIFKNRDNGTQEWDTYHAGLTDATYFIQLNSNNAQSNTNGALRFNSTAPTSSVFSVGSATTTNESGNAMIAYCFAEKKGYSKFGSFNGNGSADGTFVYTGFKPAFIITKRSSGTGNWLLHDNKRNGYNGGNNYLYPDASDAELTTQLLDITSNGFKMRFAGGTNSSGTSIYMAFAENPLVANTGGGIPATAR